MAPKRRSSRWNCCRVNPDNLLKPPFFPICHGPQMEPRMAYRDPPPRTRNLAASAMANPVRAFNQSAERSFYMLREWIGRPLGCNTSSIGLASGPEGRNSNGATSKNLPTWQRATFLFRWCEVELFPPGLTAGENAPRFGTPRRTLPYN